MSLMPFWGEFLFNPIPLELSFNTCSHGCKYCFNELNKSDIKCNIKATTNLVMDYKNRNTYVAMLLQKGYPVVMSNRSDPLARSNQDQSIPLIRLMQEMGINMAFQTKGGEKFDELMSILDKPSWFYISISHDQDKTRKLIEPGAPSIDERFRMVSELRKKGHRVSVGVNPLIPQWIQDDKAFVDRLSDSGVEAIWGDKLHFNRKQIGNMSQRTADSLGKELITHGMAKKADQEFECYHDNFQALCESVGIYFGSTKSYNNAFWRPLQETYNRLFPTNIDFLNHCYDKFEDNTAFAYSYFKRNVIDKFPLGKWSINNYIKNKGFRYAKKYNLPARMDLDEIGKILWNEDRHPVSIGFHPWFAQVAEKNEKGEWFRPCDDDGLPYYMFRRSGFDSYMVDSEGNRVD